VIASERTRMYPLRPRMPPPLLAAAHLLKVGRGTREGDLVSQVRRCTSLVSNVCIRVFVCPPADPLQSPHGLLAAALEEIDCVVDKLLLPWLAAVAVPIDGLMSRLHSGLDIEPQGGVAGATESPFAAALERYCEGLAGYQLRVLGTSTVAETVRKALAFVFLLYLCDTQAWFDLSMTLGVSDLHADAAQVRPLYWPSPFIQLLVESAALCLIDPSVQLSFMYRLRAPLVFCSSPLAWDVPTQSLEPSALSFLSMTDLAAAVALGSGADLSVQEQQRRSKISTMLRSLRASSLLQALTARLPRECSMPHSFAQMSPGQYSALLDSAALEAHVSRVLIQG